MIKKIRTIRVIKTPYYGVGVSAIVGLTILASCAADAPWGNTESGKGRIYLTLNTTDEVECKIPKFRATEQPAELVAPEGKDFRISLNSVDGSFQRSWDSLEEFNREPVFSAGHYTLTASYGSKDRCGFDGLDNFHPAFEGKTEEFNISDGDVKEISVTAALVHSMIHVEYGENLTDLYTGLQTIVKSDECSDELVFKTGETASGYVVPGELTIDLTLTRQSGETVTIQAATQFPAEKQHKYNLKFDTTEGGGSLTLTFDDSLTEEDVEIELTDDIFTTPKPMITPVGFSAGSTVREDDWSKVAEGKYAFDFVAYTGVMNAILKVETRDENGVDDFYDIDLCTASETDLKDNGIKLTGMAENTPGTKMDGKKVMGIVDISGLCKAKGDGAYQLTLNVTDNLGRVAESSSVIFSNEAVYALIQAEESSADFVNGTASVSVKYNGDDPENDISFETEGGVICNATLSTATRSIADKIYKYTVTLPAGTYDEDITIYPKIKGDRQMSGKIEFKFPYTIETDAYSYYTLVKVTPRGATTLGSLLENLKFQINGSDVTATVTDATEGILRIGVSTPGDTYALKSSFNKSVWNKNGSFTAERAENIPNGNFNSLGQPLTSGTLTVGGGFKGLGVNYDIKSSFSYEQPTGWANINSLTAYSGTREANTWFRVPSSWVEKVSEGNYQSVIRSVAYDHSGTVSSLTRPYGTYYCDQAPAFSDANKKAGEIFLGKYHYNDIERENGIEFSSRPTSISFSYSYEAIDSNDQGEIIVQLLDADGKAIITSKEPITGNGQMTVLLPNVPFGKKASKLYICFRSSNQSTAPVNVPTGKALDEGLKTPSNQTLAANTYHALATGSILKIDNVEANYEMPGEAQGAPKRKTAIIRVKK